MSRSDVELVREALEHFTVLHRHLERGDLSEETVIDAVGLRLAAGIEVLSRTSDELRDRALGSRWRLMWAMRNRIAHGYTHVDLDLVRATVVRELPEIESLLRTELE